jgi:hypothetical protein
MFPYKANIDLAVRDELKHYSTDHLSRLYHDEAMGFIRLRNFIISPRELNEEIQRRLWFERLRFWLTFVLLFIAAFASIVAAIGGWRTH